MTTVLVVQIPDATAEQMRRLAVQHDLGAMSLHEIAGYLLQLLTLDELKQERARKREIAS